MVTLRTYTSADCGEMAKLFYDTVHTVNARDYTEKQLDDTWCTMESVLADNGRYLELCREYGWEYILIDDRYQVEVEL